MIVDCITCPVRGQRCDDCVVTVLINPTERALPPETASPPTLFLDAAESEAVSVFVGAGLVSAEAVAGLHARRESAQQWIPVRAVG